MDVMQYIKLKKSSYYAPFLCPLFQKYTFLDNEGIITKTTSCFYYDPNNFIVGFDMILLLK